ncbi:MAG: MFS transporter, partial [Moorella sp. (in: Bacteria)]|nr:MFS transporter [Moorella sp. (in: firmicutes)]
SLLLFYGRMGDILGYKRIYVMGLAGFIVASAACGLAPGISWLILFRAIQGVTAGMMMAVPYAIITATFPPQERGRALGLNAISISAGLALGPSLGGLVTSLWSWRMAFLINIPIGIAGLMWARKVIPELKGHPGKMDGGGAVTAFIFLFSFLLFVNQAQKAGFNSTTLIILVVAVLAALAFFYIEIHTSQPMLNIKLFKNAGFSLALLSALLNFISQYIMVFLTPFYLQRVLHYPASQVGLLMTFFPLAVMAVAPFSGALSDRIGTRVLASLGAAICALALVAMGLLPAAVGPLAIGWRLALFGIGTGIFQSPNNSAVMGAVPRPYLGIASGTLATVRNTGMALGIAIGGLVLYAFVPRAITAKISLDIQEIGSFMSGLRYAYLTGAAFTAAAALFSFIRIE